MILNIKKEEVHNELHSYDLNDQRIILLHTMEQCQINREFVRISKCFFRTRLEEKFGIDLDPSERNRSKYISARTLIGSKAKLIYIIVPS